MSDDQTYNHWRELSWRRPLTAAEQAQLDAWLAAHPEARADWEVEAALNAGLSRLPETPVSGNFTARVLQAVEREAAARSRKPQRSFLSRLWEPWLTRLGYVAVAVAIGIVSYHQSQELHRKRLAESVTLVSAVSSLPSPEVLKDFDAIQALDGAPPPDEQLLALLQ